MKVKNTRYESLLVGKLSKGCKQCVKGKKSVFFITGLCPRRCTYCPISDNKKNQDVTFINEWETKDETDVISEIRLCNSKGVGITGGDPLVSLDRTTKYIKLLKETFGKRFHIHLYTSLDLTTEENLKKLYDSGLDEIRFHPDFDKETQWDRLKLAKKYDWTVVMEIPAVPKKLDKIKKLLSKTSLYIDYLNLNELELADNEFSEVGKEYKAKDDLSYAVQGSEEAAIEIMDYAHGLGVKNIHFCTATLKDKYQLAKRIKRRAKGIKKSFDKVTSEGMLIRAAIYLKPLTHSIKATKSDIEKAEKVSNYLIELGASKRKVYVDKDFGRVLTSPRIARKYLNQLKEKKYHTYIVEEYPTKDAFPIEIEEL